MEELKQEIQTSKEEIARLNKLLQPANTSLTSPEFESLTQQIFSLHQQYQSLKELLRNKVADSLLLHEQTLHPSCSEQKFSIKAKINNLTALNEKLRTSIISRLEQGLRDFKGKATLHSQLKRLLQKEKERFELKGKIKEMLGMKSEVREGYYEVTKRLSEDNSLSLKIKYLEQANPVKAELVQSNRVKLGKLRAQIQEMRLNMDDFNEEILRKQIQTLEILREDQQATIESLKSEIKSTQHEAQIAQISPTKPQVDLSYASQKSELKSLELKITEKEKELQLCKKIKQDLITKQGLSLKHLKALSNIESSIASSPSLDSSASLSQPSRKNRLQLVSILRKENSEESMSKLPATPKTVGFPASTVRLTQSLTKKK